MNPFVLDYPKYQKFFNNCLREWYYQYSKGTNFYYANPPGILFTRLRSTRNVKDYKVLEDMSHWYFNHNKLGNYSTNSLSTPSISFNNKSNEYSNNYFTNLSHKILSILHVGYDSWYSKIIAKTSKNSFNIAFCNSYDVAFNTFYNYSMSHETDVNQAFTNLRLITGNLLNLPLLINSQVFECVVLHITNRNFKQVLNNRMIQSIHDMLVPWGCIILVTSNNGLKDRINSFFPITNGELLWADSTEMSDKLVNFEESNANSIIDDINTIKDVNNVNNWALYNSLNNCNINNKPISSANITNGSTSATFSTTTESTGGSSKDSPLNKLFITCFHKLKSPKPNSKLKKIICTK